jgi:hypothetical protein
MMGRVTLFSNNALKRTVKRQPHEHNRSRQPAAADKELRTDWLPRPKYRRLSASGSPLPPPLPRRLTGVLGLMSLERLEPPLSSLPPPTSGTIDQSCRLAALHTYVYPPSELHSLYCIEYRKSLYFTQSGTRPLSPLSSPRSSVVNML